MKSGLGGASMLNELGVGFEVGVAMGGTSAGEAAATDAAPAAVADSELAMSPTLSPRTKGERGSAIDLTYRRLTYISQFSQQYQRSVFGFPAWGRWPESNRRPFAYKASALPTELHRLGSSEVATSVVSYLSVLIQITWFAFASHPPVSAIRDTLSTTRTRCRLGSRPV